MQGILKDLVEEVVSRELSEQMVLAAGGVPGVPPEPLRKPEKRLKEVNTIADISGAYEGFLDQQEGGHSGADSEVRVSEDDQDTMNEKKKKKKSLSKTIMWMGDAAPGTIPQGKFIALEEQANPSHKVVKITCETRPSESYLSVLKDFIRFCQEKLGIEKFPHIFLHTNKKPDMTTGSYIRDDNTIHILTKNRLLVDVLRTLSHELTHRHQDESGLLDRELAKIDPMDEMGDLNTIYENEAYEKSGNFVKEFMRRYKGLSKKELYDLHESNVAGQDIHNSPKPITKFRSTPLSKQQIDFKPTGIWYSVGNEWHKWVRSEMPDWEGRYNYRLSVDKSNILHLGNYEQLVAFTKQYGVPNDSSGKIRNAQIDWPKIASKYKGIEISPYIRKARSAFLWYYGWDIASGCVWDASAITGFEQIQGDITESK